MMEQVRKLVYNYLMSGYDHHKDPIIKSTMAPETDAMAELFVRGMNTNPGMVSLNVWLEDDNNGDKAAKYLGEYFSEHIDAGPEMTSETVEAIPVEFRETLGSLVDFWFST